MKDLESLWNNLKAFIKLLLFTAVPFYYFVTIYDKDMDFMFCTRDFCEISLEIKFSFSSYHSFVTKKGAIPPEEC